MHAADSRMRGCDFLQGESVHGSCVHGGVAVAHGEILPKFEVGLDEVAFLAGAMDAEDAGGGSRGKEREEVVDETHTDVVPEGDGCLQGPFRFL